MAPAAMVNVSPGLQSFLVISLPSHSRRGELSHSSPPSTVACGMFRWVSAAALTTTPGEISTTGTGVMPVPGT
jgi:hypothetical protein